MNALIYKLREEGQLKRVENKMTVIFRKKMWTLEGKL
jgi:hypothetical protein